MKLPGLEGAEFIQFLPFTPRRKDNLAAWMVARSDGDQYGRLMVFQFPKQKVVFGPRQVVSRINQDQTIAPQITLWNQQGSQVIQGTLLIIPIEESLLYIRPLYLRGTTGRIPELKRVIVAYQGQIVMQETLEGALERLFGQGALAPESPAEPDRLTAPDGPSLAHSGAEGTARLAGRGSRRPRPGTLRARHASAAGRQLGVVRRRDSTARRRPRATASAAPALKLDGLDTTHPTGTRPMGCASTAPVRSGPVRR